MKARRFALVPIVAGLALTTPSAYAAGPFAAYGGAWRGSGRFESNGRSEALLCRSDNRPSRGGAAVALSLVCASDSFRLDIRSDLSTDGSGVHGTWTEASQNVSGSVTGTISRRQIDVSVMGSGFNANVAMRAIGKRLDFSLASQQGRVQIAMHR